ncbi:MAG: hypothetical protein R3C05_09510 [Pirellulaceae bacterium]
MTPSPNPITGVFLNNPVFDIPFSVQQTGSQPVEVQLFVSRDQGQSWKFFARQPATESGFPFQAKEDGDFWFSTRTIDARGVAYPTGNMSPQLRVYVDTTNPQVRAAADVDIDGQVVLDYAIVDVAPDEDFMQLEYMTDMVRQWMPIAIEGRPGRRPEDGAMIGRITWRPQTDWRQIYIRMIVRDKAGNQTVFNDQFERPRVAANPMSLAGHPLQPGMPPMTGAGANRSPANNNAAMYQPHPAQMPPYVPPTSQYRGANRGMTAQPVGNPQGFALNAPLAPNQPAAQGNPYSDPSTTARDNGIPAAPHSNPPTTQPIAPREAFRPLRDNQASVTSQGQVDASRETVATQMTASPQTDRLTPNDTPRVSRSKQFSLDYEVESVGNGGIEAVELWGTRDGGKSWQRWNADPDNQSPFDIEVSKEGIVGFRIVIVAANGLTTPRPVAGDPADIYVLVDTTAPKARITGATYGQDNYAGSLIIDYACNDENLGSRPISLAFSDRLDGQWTTIATGLANTGRYIWPADPQLPRQIYLRVEATDKAGNVGVHALDIPVSVQGLSPQGRINGFQPIDGESGSDVNQAALPSARFR